MSDIFEITKQFTFEAAHYFPNMPEGHIYKKIHGHSFVAEVTFYGKKNIKRVICLSGEGGLQMNIQELATIMHNKIPIKIFIFNNGGYLTIKQTQQLGFDGRIMGSDKNSGLSFPNYKKIAESHKFKYFNIKSNKKLKNTLKKIIYSKGASICELVMDPNEEQIPKAINKRTPEGKSVPTKFEDMYPFLDRKTLEENMVIELLLED